jgi:para-nitrobenzyl esterase
LNRIFGGGWAVGDGYEFGFYDGRNRAAKNDVIIVAMNYRVNTFGFLAHPALAAEAKNMTGQATTGAMGVQDQRMAMQWVQKNIAAFGGNPKQVSIFGESAGAFSVCYHSRSQSQYIQYQYRCWWFIQ